MKGTNYEAPCGVFISCYPFLLILDTMLGLNGYYMYSMETEKLVDILFVFRIWKFEIIFGKGEQRCGKHYNLRRGNCSK